LAIGNPNGNDHGTNPSNKLTKSQRQIKAETGVTVAEVGTVIKVGDGIAGSRSGKMWPASCEFPHDVRGLCAQPQEDKVGVVLFVFQKDQRR
jgi:F0F1-type ATP synthase alpha subunit